jgi:hypothetical protein
MKQDCLLEFGYWLTPRLTEELAILAMLVLGRLAEYPLLERNGKHQLTGVVIVPEVLYRDTTVKGVKGGGAHDESNMKEENNIII